MSAPDWFAVRAALPGLQDVGNRLIAAGGSELFVAILRNAADHMERLKRERGLWNEQRYESAVAELAEMIAAGAAAARELDS